MPLLQRLHFTAAHESNEGSEPARAEFGDFFGQPVACRRGSGVGGADQSELVRALDSLSEAATSLADQLRPDT
jgi:hypothetical protein